MLEPLLTAVAAVRSVAAYVLVSVYVLVVGPPGIVIALLTGRPWLLYWLGRQGVRLGLTTVGIRYRVAGGDHVDRDQGEEGDAGADVDRQPKSGLHWPLQQPSLAQWYAFQ